MNLLYIVPKNLCVIDQDVFRVCELFESIIRSTYA